MSSEEVTEIQEVANSEAVTEIQEVDAPREFLRQTKFYAFRNADIVILVHMCHDGELTENHLKGMTGLLEQYFLNYHMAVIHCMSDTEIKVTFPTVDKEGVLNNMIQQDGLAAFTSLIVAEYDATRGSSQSFVTHVITIHYDGPQGLDEGEADAVLQENCRVDDDALLERLDFFRRI